MDFLRHLFGNIRLLLIFTASDHIDFDVTHVGSIVFFLRFLTEFKILLVFEKIFWKGDCKGFQFVWTEANPEDYWPQYMTGFDVVQSTESETVLLGWLGGVGCGFLEDSKISDAEPLTCSVTQY